MKKFIAIIAFMTTMFTVNTTVANAQMNYDDVNYRIAKTHTTEYITKGDDAYRMGNYNQAMDCYKRAREYNNFKGRTIVPAREIDSKMDRCASAMRNGGHHASTYHHRNENVSTAAAVAIGGAILGGILASAVSKNKNSNNKAKAENRDMNALCNVTYNGLSYSTTVANSDCHILNVKNEFDYTVVEMEFLNLNHDDAIRIDKNTYLKDRKSGMKLALQDVENINVMGTTKVAAGEAHVFRLYFQRVSNDCSEVDLIEPGTSSWKFYHIPA